MTVTKAQPCRSKLEFNDATLLYVKANLVAHDSPDISNGEKGRLALDSKAHPLCNRQVERDHVQLDAAKEQLKLDEERTQSTPKANGQGRSELLDAQPRMPCGEMD